MAKYFVLKAERDDAIERAVIEERNSQLERVRELEAAHSAEVASLRHQIATLHAAFDAYVDAVQAAATAVLKMTPAGLSPAHDLRPPGWRHEAGTSNP